jgi:hypothetical protein
MDKTFSGTVLRQFLQDFQRVTERKKKGALSSRMRC